MNRPLLSALISCLLAVPAQGAWAAEAPRPAAPPSTKPALISLGPPRSGDTLHVPAAPEKAAATGPAAPPVEEPALSLAVCPIPFLAVYAIAAYEGFAIGPTRHELHARGGYVWTTNYLFDPDRRTPQELTPLQDANFWNFYADWGWRLAPHWTLYLDGYATGAYLTTTPGYDQDLTQGASATWGPLLQFSTLNERSFPTDGTLLAAAWAPGLHWGSARDLAFQRGSLEAQRFIPLGEDRTLAVRAVALAASPKLAWVDKYAAGGAKYLRGFQWNRFTGDRLLSSSLEYRHLFAPDLMASFGHGVDGLAVGLAWEAYVDAGRAWESTRGVPFLSDWRAGLGTGLILTLNRAPVGRLELNASPEGLFPVAGLGTAF